MLTTFFILIAAYLVGAIPTGVILTRLTGGEDIRKTGSGNIGATNVYRTAGRKLGIITLLGDALKGLLPVLTVSLSFPADTTLIALTAAASFLGHCYPIYLGFKGGKGVATALGIFLVLSPLSVLLAVFIFAGLVWKTRYVSLGSISAAAAMPICILLLGNDTAIFTGALFISAIIIWRHRENIDRLIKGQENRFKA
ncbi:acyl-phosphate glycerol 3-phosphate acyltransferase [Geothermobacter hydrogeniphilus]|uniref:Glycerol-3-phosphate acyltransferase n=1 Tax=Geothermobacter hydrogeniphilus TaxID=1969733 RepID=A0A2K2HAC6_9BACT|nr:glycerol-3-phosphate 1-O-acyltransferase PlsY [Geothermobacter hydrogeniphilus]PNU20221.1 acyl-phosphate glycerol 3-phosphate acyltransferase [Geothermobacter hydrogeniphilus]